MLSDLGTETEAVGLSTASTIKAKGGDKFVFCFSQYENRIEFLFGDLED